MGDLGPRDAVHPGGLSARDDTAWRTALLGLLPPPSLPADDWLLIVREGRIVPAAARLCTESPDRAAPGVGERLGALARERITWSMLVEHAAIEAVRALQQHDIPCIVLKGVASAHLDYPDPALREVGDVDLLVPPKLLPRADAVLSTFTVAVDLPPSRLRRRNKEQVFVTPQGVEIDVHHRLLDDPYGFSIPVDELFAEAVSYDVGGVTMSGLAPPARLAHAVVHWSASVPEHRRLSGLLDVALMAAEPAVAEAAQALLASWSLGALAQGVPGLPGAAPADRSRVLGVLHRRAMRGSRVATELASVLAQPTLTARGRELWARLHPVDELMTLHGVSRTHRLARFAARAVRARMPSRR